jgi:hypothetical protein
MLKTATTILLIGVLFGALYSVAVVFSPQTVAQSTLKTIQDRGAAEAFIGQTRHLGIFALATNIALLFILFAGFKKGQRWAWWAFLFVGGLAWIFGLVSEILEKHTMNTIGHSIGTLLWLVGLLLAVKVFFPKKA